MITIQIEPAEAFDRYSVLMIKFINTVPPQSYEILKQSTRLQSQIEKSCSKDTFTEVVNSQEYKNLYNINKKLFDLFNECKKGGIDALVPDEYNWKRHLAKKSLQKKFFNEEFSEVKLGYR